MLNLKKKNLTLRLLNLPGSTLVGSYIPMPILKICVTATC